MAELAYDLCAGARGWEATLDEDDDLRTIGFEIDDDACATARAAGLHTVQDDISRLVPEIVALVYGKPDGIIGSPPCQLFSGAGKGTGRLLMEELHRAVTDAARGASDIVMARHRRELRRLLHRYLRESEGYKRTRTCRQPLPRHKRPAESSPIRRGELRSEADRMARNVALVWQPARWVARLRPRWVALEQVPAVLPLWEAMARGLEVHGYRCWTGVLSAERYGVPQTRKRAILLACLDRQPQPPEATHQAYVPGEPARDGEPDLFGPGLKAWISMAQALGWGSGRYGFPQLDDTGMSEDGYRERDWRSTVEPAFAMTEKVRSFVYQPDVDPDDIEVELNRSEGSGGRRPRKGSEPAPTIRGGAGGGCGPNLTVKLVNGTHEHRAERDIDEPAPTRHFGGRLNTVSFVQSGQTNATKRDIDEPAPTIKGGHDTANRQWVQTNRDALRDDQADLQPYDPDRVVFDRRQGSTGAPVGPRASSDSDRQHQPQGLAKGRDVWRENADDPHAYWNREKPTHYDSRQQRDTRTGEPKYARRRALEEPAPTIAGESRNDAWALERPATTVAGDPRVFPPGHKVNGDDVAAGRGGQQRSGAGHTNGASGDTAVRVSVREAATLQSFPGDWPFHGTQTSQFQQVGNAIPPRLARAILVAVRS
jgi:DNA (cytosine-5)-methyltransferase 1